MQWTCRNGRSCCADLLRPPSDECRPSPSPSPYGRVSSVRHLFVRLFCPFAFFSIHPSSSYRIHPIPPNRPSQVSTPSTGLASQSPVAFPSSTPSASSTLEGLQRHLPTPLCDHTGTSAASGTPCQAHSRTRFPSNHGCSTLWSSSVEDSRSSTHPRRAQVPYRTIRSKHLAIIFPFRPPFLRSQSGEPEIAGERR